MTPSKFTYKTNLRLAWIHIHTYGTDKAFENIPIQLQKFVKAAGAMHKYNATVTIAAIKAVNQFKLKSSTQNCASFIWENFELKSNFIDLLNTHYGFII